MADYFDASGDPANNSDIDSSVIRSVWTLLAAAFAKVAGYTGNGGKIVAINAGGTAQEAITTTGTGSGVRATSPSFTTAVISASTTLAVFNTVATTVNAFGGCSVALNIGHASGTNTILGATTFSQAITASSTINKVTITAPATSATLTIANTGSLITSGAYAITLTATGTTNVTLPTTGTLAALGVTAGAAVQVDQAVTAWTRSATTTLDTTLNGTLSDTSTTITAFAGVAGVTYHCRSLGAGSITHHATNLIVTQTGASITTAAGDTWDTEMLTATTCRIKNYMLASGAALVSGSVGDHSVVVNTGNGHGSTNTKIRRYVTTQSSTGTDITYADSATLGATFTINTAGLYGIYTTDYSAAGGSQMGASVNTTNPTSNIGNDTATKILILTTTGAAGKRAAGSRVVMLAVNDVVRPHTDGSLDGISSEVVFSVIRIG